MPKRIKTTTVKEELPETEASKSDDISDLVIVLSKVYRVNGGLKSFAFQSDTPIDELYVQNQCPNGGKFIVQELNANGEQVNSYSLDIEPKLATHTNGNGNTNTSDLRSQMLADELAFTRNMMLQLISGLVGQKATSQQTPVTELVQAVQGIHALAPGGKDPIELLIKGMDLANKYGGNGGSSGDWKTELLDVAKTVLPGAINAFGAARPPTGETMLPSVNTPIVSTPVNVLNEGLIWLKSRIIAGQMSPDFAAEMLIQFGSTDPKYQSILATAISKDINAFIEVDPEIANEPYKTWFTAAIGVVKEWYAEQNRNDDDMDGGIGNPTDTKPNAPTSPKRGNNTKAV